MKTVKKTPEQIKGAIRNMAQEKSIRAQDILQVYLFERLLERLSLSPYKDMFILKGGLLISAMIGIEERTTMDMDTTVKGIAMNENNLTKTLQVIFSIDVDDDVTFVLDNLRHIREDSAYENFRASITAFFGKSQVQMKIDITTGDVITPSEISFDYPMLFETRKLHIKAYPIETVLAEKFQAIIYHSLANTRARDFYDIYVLYNLYKNTLDWELVSKAIIATANSRESIETLKSADTIISQLYTSIMQNTIWKRYSEKNKPAHGLEFKNVLDTLHEFYSNLSLD